MKKIIKTGLFIAAFTLTYFIASAQQEDNPVPKWVSEKGYWVVESNKNTPKDSKVYFYNSDHVLVYQEEIKNQKLKLKKKTLMKLKAALEEAVDSYEKGTWAGRNKIVNGRGQYFFKVNFACCFKVQLVVEQ